METNGENTDATEVSPLLRRIDLSVSIADLEKDVEQRLRRVGKTMKMPGFRPGKVPPAVIRQQHGAQANHEALRSELARLLNEALEERRWRIAGAPRLEAEAGDSDTHLQFSAEFEVYPDIVLHDLSSFEIERSVLEVGQTEIDRTIEILRKQRVRYEIVDRPAAAGDQVSIDFLGRKDGEPFAGGQGQDYRFVLGEGRMLSDFENAVAGTRAGESKSFEMTFPAEYFSAELAGQTVSFELTVKEVGEPILPAIDGDFALALGIADGDLEKMRSEIETNLRREVKRRLQARVTQQVMDLLLKANPIDVPQALLAGEIERLQESVRQDMRQRGMSAKELPMPADWFAEQARRRVALGLILAEIATANDIRAQPRQVRALVEEAAQSYEHPEQIVSWHYAQPERLREFEGAAMEAQVVDWVLAQAKVVDKPVVFAELMGHTS